MARDAFFAKKKFRRISPGNTLKEKWYRKLIQKKKKKVPSTSPISRATCKGADCRESRLPLCTYPENGKFLSIGIRLPSRSNTTMEHLQQIFYRCNEILSSNVVAGSNEFPTDKLDNVVCWATRGPKIINARFLGNNGFGILVEWPVKCEERPWWSSDRCFAEANNNRRRSRNSSSSSNSNSSSSSSNSNKSRCVRRQAPPRSRWKTRIHRWATGAPSVRKGPGGTPRAATIPRDPARVPGCKNSSARSRCCARNAYDSSRTCERRPAMLRIFANCVPSSLLSR